MDSRKPFCELPDFEERITLEDCDTYLDSAIHQNDDDDCEPTRDDEYREVYEAIMAGDIRAINTALAAMRAFYKLPY